MDNLREYLGDPQQLLQHLPPPLQQVAGYLPYLFRWLFNTSFSSVIYHFQNLGNQLTRLVRTPPSELQAQDIAFPVLSLVLVYFAVRSALNTARYAFNVGFWLLKWGTLLGLLAAGWAWYNGDPNAVGQGQARGRSTAFSLVEHAWNLVNGQQQRDWFANDPEFVDWSGWVGDWLGGQGRERWVEVVDGLGAENVRKAAEEWWETQVDGKPKGKGKGKKSSKQSKNKQKGGKSSRVR